MMFSSHPLDPPAPGWCACASADGLGQGDNRGKSEEPDRPHHSRLAGRNVWRRHLLDRKRGRLKSSTCIVLCAVQS